MSWEEYPQSEAVASYGFRFKAGAADEMSMEDVTQLDAAGFEVTSDGEDVFVSLEYKVLAESEQDAQTCAYMCASMKLRFAGIEVPWVRFRD